LTLGFKQVTIVTMLVIGIAELKAHLSKYLRLVKNGQEIGVRDRSDNIARIVPSVPTGLPLSARPATSSLRDVVIPPLRRRIDVVSLLREERGER
jgi:antitoxin (DNA-binding transcriptional repressor) of toxin-antitoxin stability system